MRTSFRQFGFRSRARCVAVMFKELQRISVLVRQADQCGAQPVRQRSQTVLSASAARRRAGDPYPAMGSRQELRAACAEKFQHGACRRQQDLVLSGKDEPLPDNRKTNYVERDQPPLIELGGNRVRRNECNSETRDHSLLDRLVAAHRHADLGANSRGFEQLLHQAARTGTGLARQKRFVGKVAQRDAGFSHQAMARRRDDDMGVIADRVDVHVDISRRAAHDREIEIIAP